MEKEKASRVSRAQSDRNRFDPTLSTRFKYSCAYCHRPTSMGPTQGLKPEQIYPPCCNAPRCLAKWKPMPLTEIITYSFSKL